MKKCTFINSLVLFLSLTAIVHAEVQKDISYSSNSHPLKQLNIYTPRNNINKKLPVLIHIHGGGWKKTGDKKIQRQHGTFY
jgi:carboxylesterase type B